MQETKSYFKVREISTGNLKGEFSSLARARSKRDKLDLQHGCYNYRIEQIA